LQNGDQTVDGLLEDASGNRAAVDSDLKFNNTNRTPDPQEIRVGVTYTRENDGRRANVFMTENAAYTELDANGVWQWRRFNHTNPERQGLPYGPNAVISQLGTHQLPLEPGSNLVIKVSSDQEGCIIQDTSTKDILLDSRGR